MEQLEAGPSEPECKGNPSTQAEVLPDGGGYRYSQPKWRGPKVRERNAQGGAWGSSVEGSVAFELTFQICGLYIKRSLLEWFRRRQWRRRHWNEYGLTGDTEKRIRVGRERHFDDYSVGSPYR